MNQLFGQCVGYSGGDRAGEHVRLAVIRKWLELSLAVVRRCVHYKIDRVGEENSYGGIGFTLMKKRRKKKRVLTAISSSLFKLEYVTLHCAQHVCGVLEPQSRAGKAKR